MDLIGTRAAAVPAARTSSNDLISSYAIYVGVFLISMMTGTNESADTTYLSGFGFPTKRFSNSKDTISSHALNHVFAAGSNELDFVSILLDTNES